MTTERKVIRAKVGLWSWPSLQDHGVLAGQLLSFSGALREGWRGRPGGDH
jgi:hypothetical protein